MQSLVNARCVLVIPARRASTRLADKMLLRDTGKTVLQHTWERACKAERPDAVVIATDDDEIAREARRFGADVIMTSRECNSGTDRVAEAARELPQAEILVNLQGDEPDMDPAAIDRVIGKLQRHPAAGMATAAAPIRSREQLDDPACVKVTFDHQGRALYFSRSPIPHPREWDDALLASEPPTFHLHLGIYAYRRLLLERITSLPMSELESVEKLEQLRVLECGESILIAPVDHACRGIDTPADYAEFVQRHAAA
ncbi:MAG: 3-deoxy-manno-octulosonate cytidylyltransferase [Planctomycetaceae bacterium]|nr:3-deoxy-manno-octulosonate cytidylyltransferase [Planctomycetaceae bacterium]